MSASTKQPHKTFSAHDIASTEIPFRWVSQGVDGALRVAVDAHSATGLDTGHAALVSTATGGGDAGRGFVVPGVPAPRVPAADSLPLLARLHDAAVPETGVVVRPAPLRHALELCRDHNGNVVGWREYDDPLAASTSSNSTSFQRAPGRASQSVRGSVSNLPFRPGGLDAPVSAGESVLAPEVRELLLADVDSLCRVDASVDGLQRTSVDAAFEVPSAASLDADASAAAPAASVIAPRSNPANLLSAARTEIAAEVAEAPTPAARVEISDLFAQDFVLDDSDDSGLDDDEPVAATPPAATAPSSAPAAAAPVEVDEDLEDLEALLHDEHPESSLPTASIPELDTAEERRKKQKSTWAVMERLSVDNFYEEVPNMALKYPFELDRFQKEAVMHLERGESVFVSAHTSAGKTVVAEYAIALAAKHLTKAVYTSPIKTLSNQKFREFRNTFGDDDVGILTGDVSINPEASCLILTTEILRSMLYRGSDTIRDVEWVIFDEVHYVNDPDRGVVWEEVIIMLPPHVNIILLSATVPNTFEFADWVGRTKKKRVHVISTYKRPVPLQHYLWCHRELFRIVDEHGHMDADGFRRARRAGADDTRSGTKTSSGRARGRGRGRGRGKGGGFRQGGGSRRRGGQVDKSNWHALVNYLKKRELLPLAVFSFSKKKCDECADGLQSLDLTTGKEKSEVHLFCEAALSRLQGSDRELPQVLRIRDLVKRGIGVHHAGMLPILKEVVEMMFSRGLVKVLFATETFAMGVNMPTKTVVFNGVRKHDGRGFRDLLPGEYTQMSGRAGRRGLDSFGIVAINCRNDEVPSEMSLRALILGKSTRLESQFRLTYNMILNLLRQEDMKVEEMIKRSFSEFFTQRDAPKHREMLEKDRARLDSMGSTDCLFGEPTIEDYYAMSAQVNRVTQLVMQHVLESPKLRKRFLDTGRVLVLNKYNMNNVLGLLLVYSQSARHVDLAQELAPTAGQANPYHVLILCPVGWKPSRRLADKLASASNVHRGTTTSAGGASYLIVPLRAGDVVGIADTCVEDVDAGGILVEGFDSAIDTAVAELAALRAAGDWRDTLKLLDARKDMKINDLDLAEQYDVQMTLAELMAANQCHKCPKLPEHYAAMQRQSILQHRMTQLQHALSDDNVKHMEDFSKMLTVLTKLKYVDDTRTVQLKGRVACEINTCESLIVTELVFENVLTDLAPEEIVALLSCLVFQQKSDAKPVLTEQLHQACERMTAIATQLGEVQRECQLDVAPAEFVRDNINTAMTEVVYEWAKGTAFAEICYLTDVPEGTIVRCILRLDETCRDVRNAARVIGDAPLYQKMELCSEMIKRDIVFAASLYVT